MRAVMAPGTSLSGILLFVRNYISVLVSLVRDQTSRTLKWHTYFLISMLISVPEIVGEINILCNDMVYRVGQNQPHDTNSNRYSISLCDNSPTDNWPKVNSQTKTDRQKIFTDTTTERQRQVADTTTHRQKPIIFLYKTYYHSQLRLH